MRAEEKGRERGFWRAETFYLRRVRQAERLMLTQFVESHWAMFFWNAIRRCRCARPPAIFHVPAGNVRRGVPFQERGVSGRDTQAPPADAGPKSDGTSFTL